MTTLLIPITLAMAFCVGYAIRRGSVCVVLATRALIVDRKAARFRSFLVAAAGSGAVIVPLHWALPEIATLSAGYPVTVTVVLAGAGFGIGARINGACALGTLAHLTGGDLRYLATALGMVSGAVLVAFADFDGVTTTTLRPSSLEAPTPFAVVFVLLLALSLAVALYRRLPRWWRALRDPDSMRMGPYRSMLVVGIMGGLLYALAGNWTYMAVLSQRAARLVDPTLLPSGWPALLCIMAVGAGGITAALKSNTFVFKWPSLKGSALSLTGGAIMGASAALIPGGNGTLLLHGLPSLAPHALAAYGAMTVTLCLCFWVARAEPKTA